MIIRHHYIKNVIETGKLIKDIASADTADEKI